MTTKLESGRISIFDNVIILLAIGLVLTYVPNILFPGWRYLKYFGVCFLLMVSFVRDFTLIKPKFDISFFFFLYIIIALFIDILISVVIGSETFLRAGSFIMLYALFYFFLQRVYHSGQDPGETLKMMLKPYVYFAIFIVVTGVVIYLLASLKIVDIEGYAIPSIYGYEYTKEIDPSSEFFIGESYLLTPYYITILSTDSRIGPFLPYVLTGMSYEPHISCFFVLPSFFLLRLFFKNTRLYVLMAFYVIFLLFSLSVTAILTFTMVVVISFLLRANTKKFLIAGSLFVVATVIFVNSELFELLREFFNYKINVSDSKSVSANFIDKILSPNEIVGDGVLTVPDNQFVTDRSGLYESLYFLFYYAFIIYAIVKLILRKNDFSSLIGFALMYLFIHSIKFPYHQLNYPFTFFLVFIGLKYTDIRLKLNEK